ncbi:hypothetical protein ACH4RA_23365 [Streptomyces smyrnaeus]|uniref:hypothetical protein n=1 Tax=Streptomyces smyrnaeus TaxID=1387713 RepID=UPI0037B7E600
MPDINRRKDLAGASGATADRVNPDKPFTFDVKVYLLPRGEREFKAYVDQWIHLTTYDSYAADWLGSPP